MITTRMPQSLSKGQEKVYLCLLSLQEELKDADQWAAKEGVWQSCGFQKESSQAEVVPTIKKHSGGCVSCEGWKHSEYRAKVNALLKPRSGCPSTTLVLQPVNKFKHKHKHEKTLPLEIRDKVQEDFVFVHKKCLTKHGGQAIKQVSKLERIFKLVTQNH